MCVRGAWILEKNIGSQQTASQKSSGGRGRARAVGDVLRLRLEFLMLVSPHRWFGASASLSLLLFEGWDNITLTVASRVPA